MKKKFYAVYAGILTACLSLANLHASAYTADDVANKAREAGWPESLIQTGYNQWASGQYTQEQLDQAYNSVLDYNEQTEEFIYNQFGIDPDEAREEFRKKETTTTAKPASTQKTTTKTVTQPAVDDVQPNPEPDYAYEEEVQQKTPSASTQTQNQTTSQNQPSTTTTTTTKNQSTTESRTNQFIPDSEFISMTMEEKQEYVNSLNAEEKVEFIATLSTEARNSIIKQLPMEEKMAIMQKYIDTAGTMGMNVTVDEITDNDISVTVRNHDGVVIDKAEVGIVIDETGISHTKPLLFAGIGILASASGFAWLYWYIKRTEND